MLSYRRGCVSGSGRLELGDNILRTL